MSGLADLFDSYGLRARLYPGLLVGLPVLAYAASDYRSLVQLAWPVAVAAGAPFLLANVVRSRGKAVERKLLAAWGAFPTTLWLRHRDEGPAVRRDHWRARLSAVLGVQLPSVHDETVSPSDSDARYGLAVDQLISRVRAKRDHFSLVHEENIGYGFRRNLLGMKGWALGVVSVCLIIDGIRLREVGAGMNALTFLLGAHLLIFLGWLFIVRASWVREAADDYAKRLFATLDDPQL